MSNLKSFGLIMSARDVTTMAKKINSTTFQAILKQTGKSAIRIDSEGEGEITFTVSALEIAGALAVLAWGASVLTVTVEPSTTHKDETGFKI